MRSLLIAALLLIFTAGAARAQASYCEPAPGTKLLYTDRAYLILPKAQNAQPSSLRPQVDGPDAVFEGLELERTVQRAMQALDPEHREAIVLRDIEGFGYEEVAEILNINLGTVKSRLMRGRAHLKTRLTPLVRASATPSTASPDCSSTAVFRAPLAGLREAK